MQVFGSEVLGVPWSEAEQFLELHGLHPAIVYQPRFCSCEDEDPRHFCFVVVVDQLITDWKIAKKIQDGLNEVFGDDGEEIDCANGDASFEPMTSGCPGAQAVLEMDADARMSVEQIEAGLWSCRKLGYSSGTNLRSARRKHREGFGLPASSASVRAEDSIIISDDILNPSTVEHVIDNIFSNGDNVFNSELVSSCRDDDIADGVVSTPSDPHGGRNVPATVCPDRIKSELDSSFKHHDLHPRVGSFGQNKDHQLEGEYSCESTITVHDSTMAVPFEPSSRHEQPKGCSCIIDNQEFGSLEKNRCGGNRCGHNSANDIRIQDFPAKLESNCQLWRDLLACTDPDAQADVPRLTLNSIQHLFANLTSIRGGLKAFRQLLEEIHRIHPDWSEHDPRHWDGERKRQLANPPTRCITKHCAHMRTCRFAGLTVVDAARGMPPAGKPVEIEPRQVVPVQAAERLMKDQVGQALRADDSKVHLIRAPAGLGKTECYIEHIATDGGRFLIAVPTHALAEEIVDRLKQLGVDAAKRPENPAETMPTNDQHARAVRHLFRIGAHGAAAHYIRKHQQLVPEFEQFHRALEEAERHDVTVTTHAALAHLPDNFDADDRRIIIDEDPIPTLIQMGRVELGALSSMRKPVNGEEAGVAELTEKLWREVSQAPIDTVQSRTTLHKDWATLWCGLAKRAISNVGMSGADEDKKDVLGLFRAEQMMVSDGIVHHARSIQLPSNVNIVLLSATADPDICRHVLGDRIVCHEIPDVALAGKIIQHASHSFSRQALQNMSKQNLQQLVDAVGDAPTITYSKWKKTFRNPSQMHFGNLDGMNGLEGCDLNVVGTPNINPVALHLMAAVMGRQNVNMETPRLGLNRHLGFAWQDYCYADDPMLLALQNYTRHSALMQAIGRARLVRESATVNIWTNIPVPGAEVVD